MPSLKRLCKCGRILLREEDCPVCIKQNKQMINKSYDLLHRDKERAAFYSKDGSKKTPYYAKCMNTDTWIKAGMQGGETALKGATLFAQNVGALLKYVIILCLYHKGARALKLQTLRPFAPLVTTKRRLRKIKEIKMEFKLEGLDKIDKLVRSLAEFKNKGLNATAKEVLKKQANIAASQMRNNIKKMTRKDSTRTLRKSIRVRSIKRRGGVIGYKIIVLKKLLDRKPLKHGQKSFYYAIALEYGHVDKGWNARGNTHTKARPFVKLTKRQMRYKNIDEKIIERVSKSLQKSIAKSLTN